MKNDLLTDTRDPVLRTSVVGLMAVGAGLGTATMYVLQPGMAAVAGSLHGSVAEMGIALACGPVGYLLGLALLVPLVDRHPPRTVVSLQFAALAAASAIGAAVGVVWLLGPVIGLVGAASSVGAQMSSVASRFAEPNRRATVLGTVTAGISAGVLAGRIVGGWLTDLIGWRGMLLVFAAACAALAVATRVVLPAATATVASGYLTMLRGLPGLFTRYPLLRSAAGRGALWFFAFCTVWAGLAAALSQPPFSYSAERIGLYAFAGLAGVAATRIAGAWTDRVGARRVILVGLVVAGAAAVTLAVALSNTVLALVCLGLFDAGLFAAQVANQSTVLAIDPGSPARFNSAYMVVYFVGGSAGTAFGAAAVSRLGWATTAVIAALAIVVAAVMTAGGSPASETVQRRGHGR
ncbi:MFS transporter [Nocardia aobensis]|uniref:MFS transporter n=1 Tax=Nocardia aobensis TaxID=257277 RepID=UPI0006856926|nr:MFS transporter [Nocardia aobensis]